MEIEQIKQSIADLASQETKLAKTKAEFLEANKAFSERLAELDQAQAVINDGWDTVKQALSQLDYTDAIDLPQVKITVSKVMGVGVVDIDQVPEEFVEVKKVADDKKLKDYMKLYGEVPAGCANKSYYRMTKKLKEV